MGQSAAHRPVATSVGLDDRAAPRACRRRPGPALRALEAVRRPRRRPAEGDAAVLARRRRDVAGRGRRGGRPVQPPLLLGPAARGPPRDRPARGDVLDLRPGRGPRRRDPHRLGIARRPHLELSAAHDPRRPALPAHRGGWRSVRGGLLAPPPAAGRSGGAEPRFRPDLEAAGRGRDLRQRGRRRAARDRRPGASSTTGTRWGRGNSAIPVGSPCRTARSSRSSMPARARPAALAGHGWRCRSMRITSIESRILGYDIGEIWLPEGPPEGISSTFYRYSFDTFHTDEGIDGYTMQNSNLEDGGGDGPGPARRVCAPAHRRGPAPGRGAVAEAAPPEPPRLQPLRRRGRLHRRGALGHPRQGRQSADRRPAGAGPRQDPGVRHGADAEPHAGDGLQGGAAAPLRGLPRLQDPVLGRPGARHPALPRRPRGRRRRLPADAGRGRDVLVRAGPGRRSRAGRPELRVVRGAHSRTAISSS